VTAAILFLADALIDGSGAPPQRPGAVLVDGERIAAVGLETRNAASTGTRIIDLPGCTLLPGLIDAHLHLDGWRSLNRTDWVFMDDGLRAIGAACDAARILAAGFTSVRDMGSVAAVLADLIAVRGDPLADIRVLREPVLVVQGGRPIPPDIGQWPHDAPVPFRMLQLEKR